MQNKLKQLEEERKQHEVRAQETQARLAAQQKELEELRKKRGGRCVIL
jgi:hypothetical protein